MKKFLMALLLSVPAIASAGPIVCETSKDRLIVHASTPTVITVSLNGETVPADGLVTNEEVDLVAKFPRQGEMTLYARMDKKKRENYLFIKGQRNPVQCR